MIFTTSRGSSVTEGMSLILMKVARKYPADGLNIESLIAVHISVGRGEFCRRF